MVHPDPLPQRSLLSSIVVSIGFDPTMYQANEDDGTVEVTVKVLSGDLSGPVIVNIATVQSSATGKSIHLRVTQIYMYMYTTAMVVIKCITFSRALYVVLLQTQQTTVVSSDP